MNKLLYRYIAIVLFLLPAFLINNVAFADTETTGKNDRITYNVAMLENDFVAKAFFYSIEETFNYKFNYHEYTSFEQLVSSLVDKSNDLAANIGFTKERLDYINISSPTNIMYTYFYSKSKVFAEAKSLAIPKSSSFYEDIVSKVYPNLTLVPYNDSDEALALLESNKVDGALDTMFALEKYLSNGFGAEILNDKMPIPPVALASSFNIEQQQLEKIAKLLQTSENQALFRNNVEQYQLKLRKQAIKNEAKKLGIDLSQPIYIKLDTHAPIAYYSEDEWRGIAPEILREVCSILEANCQIISQAEESWQNMYQQLKKGDIDLLAPMVVTDERKSLFNFSETYFTSDIVILKRHGYRDNTYNDLSELIMERVGAIKDDNFKDILTNALPNKQLIKYDTTDQKIQALINEEIDYILVNRFDYHLAMKNANNSLPIQIDTFFSHNLIANDAFAFPSTDRGEKLAHLFNLGLDIVNTKPIIAKYDVTPDWMLILSAQKRGKMMVYLFFIVAILIISFFMYFLHRRSTIDELTKLKNRRALYAKYGRKGIKPNIRLVYLDVNSFKTINDTYGHNIGDKVIITLSQRIKRYWKGDAYRIGGDEFILIGSYPKDKKCELVQTISNFTLNAEDKELTINSSAGFYSSENETTSIDEALHQADISMYENKKRYYSQQINHERRKTR